MAAILEHDRDHVLHSDHDLHLHLPAPESLMARVRNWTSRQFAEVFVRLDHGQSIAQVARLTGLAYQQVSTFDQQMRADTSKLPTNVQPIEPSDIEQLHVVVAAEIEAAKTAATPVGGARVATASDEAIEAEVIGCIDLVRESAAQLGISPRRFLWLCSTHARSA